MSKPKPTVSDQLDASAIIQKLIDNHLAKHEGELPDGVVTVLNRHYKRLIKADERLLQSKPPRTRKPKTIATTEPEAMPTVKMERWGRDGRNG